MKAKSDNHPGQFTCTHSKWFYNYNIVESEVTDELGTRIVYNYDYVEITGDPDTDQQIAWDQTKVDAFIDAMDIAAKERPTLKCDIDISKLQAPSDAAQKKADAIQKDRGWKIQYAK